MYKYTRIRLESPNLNPFTSSSSKYIAFEIHRLHIIAKVIRPHVYLRGELQKKVKTVNTSICAGICRFREPLQSTDYAIIITFLHAHAE